MNIKISFKLVNYKSLLELTRSFRLSRSKVTVENSLNKFNNNLSLVHYNEKRLLKIAIIGAPNAGKSTLINQIVKRKVFPISKKVHTTRFRARAVYNENNVQLVFLDTPGLVTITESEKYNLHREFVTGGEDAIVEADIIGVVHDVSNHFTRKHLDPKVLRLLHLYNNKDSFLILNKVDTVKSKRLLLGLTNILTGNKLKTEKIVENQSPSEKAVQDIIKEKKYWEQFNNVFMISSLLGTGANELKTYLLNSAKCNDWLFPEDTFTDQNHKQIIEETVRSKLLEHLPQEVPYNLNVELEYLDEENEDTISAVVIVGCNKTRIENLIKGSGGQRIRTIALEAEQSLADAFLTNFYLKLVIINNER